MVYLNSTRRPKNYVINPDGSLGQTKHKANDLRNKQFVPMTARHSVLRSLEGWYTAVPSPKDLSAKARRFGFPMPSIVRRYDIQKGNKPKFSRWLASKQGKEAVDSETRWSCHTPEEIDVLIQRFVKKFYTKQEPLSFKLTCQFDDFRRMSENKDFGSCFADTGSQSQAKYSLMSDPTVCMLYTADKSGKIVWRTLAHLGKDIKGFCLILVRPYGDESTPVLDIVEALKQKIRVAATTHVDFIIPIRATDFQLCYPERVVGDTFPYYTDLLTHFSDTSVYEKPLSSKARGI